MAFEAAALRRLRLGWRWWRFEGYEPALFPFCGLLLLALLPVAPPAGLAAAAAIWLASGFEVSVPGSWRTRKPALGPERIALLEELHHVPVGEPLARGERTYLSRLTLNAGTALIPLGMLVFLAIVQPAWLIPALALFLPVALLTCLLGSHEPGVGVLLPPYAGLGVLPLVPLVGGNGLLAAAAAGVGVTVGSLVLAFSAGRDEPGAPVYRIGGKGAGGAVVLAAVLAQLL